MANSLFFVELVYRVIVFVVDKDVHLLIPTKHMNPQPCNDIAYVACHPCTAPPSLPPSVPSRRGYGVGQPGVKGRHPWHRGESAPPTLTEKRDNGGEGEVATPFSAGEAGIYVEE